MPGCTGDGVVTAPPALDVVLGRLLVAGGVVDGAAVDDAAVDDGLLVVFRTLVVAAAGLLTLTQT